MEKWFAERIQVGDRVAIDLCVFVITSCSLCVNVTQEHDAVRFLDKGGCSDCGRPMADKMADFALETQGGKPVPDPYSYRRPTVTSFTRLLVRRRQCDQYQVLRDVSYSFSMRDPVRVPSVVSV